MKYLFLAIIFTFIIHFCYSSDNWSQFRGTQGDGVSSISNLPTEWGNDMNLQWKCKIPGNGWSSPIVWEDKVFITTAIRDKEDPVAIEGDDDQTRQVGNRIMPDKDYRFEVYCLNKNTGDIIWKDVSYRGKPGIITHIDNTYASETPVTDGEHVYVYFGMVGLYCYDLDGKKVLGDKPGCFPNAGKLGLIEFSHFI